MNRVTHFEIAAKDPEKSVEFYRSVFGWKVDAWPDSEDYWTIATGPESEEGIDGGIYPAKTPGEVRMSVSVLVDSIDAYTEKVVAHGGSVVVPKRAIAGVGWLAYCSDCDGTVFCLHQEESPAE